MITKNPKPTIEDLKLIPTLLSYDLAPSGEFLIFASNHDGIAQLYLQPINDPSNITQLTFGDTPTTNGKISPNSDSILFRKDLGGTEMDDLYVLNLKSMKIEQITTNPSRVMGFCWSPDQTKVARAVVGQMDCQIEIISLPTKEKTVLTSSSLPYIGISFSPDGMWISTTHLTEQHTKTIEILNIENPKTKYIIHLDENSNETAVSWSSKANKIAFITDVSGSRQYAVSSFPPKETIEYSLLKLETDEEIDPDCEGCVFLGENIITQVSKHSQTSIFRYSYDALKRIKIPFPEGYILEPRISFGSQYIYALHSAINSPKDIYRVDLDSNTHERITSLGHKYDFSTFPRVKSIWYDSFDGQKIHAWYYPPLNAAEKAPVVVSIHGGPYWQHFNSFETGQSMLTLALAGYAVFAPNIRGSTGYGKKFQDLNKGDIGGGDLDDIEYAVKWLKKQQEIDKNRIACFGPSYGGYLTLMALTKKPTLFKTGISFVPLTDLEFLHEKADPAYRGFAQMLLGGSLEEKRELYLDRSPITHVDHIQAPVLIGAAIGDSRCPFEPIQHFVDHLLIKNHPHKFLTQDDMGHASAESFQSFQEMLWNQMICFLDKYL
ncbi:alpha/beta fold hydrolase [Candidatus Lokiarchaeum ossiferum]|uniref:alpha/beta fold hydrolase n=1 Tax=Candidatus Lokiarchaeum ossiferum TaxID=2951803 RepID=UPI00352C6FE3